MTIKITVDSTNGGTAEYSFNSTDAATAFMLGLSHAVPPARRHRKEAPKVAGKASTPKATKHEGKEV